MVFCRARLIRNVRWTINEEFALTVWSRWFRGESSRSADASTSTPSLTIGEVVGGARDSLGYIPGQRCLLCEARANIEVGESEAQIECAACGQYCASLDAARALDALVKYREPGLAEMRKMLTVHRQNHADRMPRIRVQYVVSDGVPTFYLASD
jgi:hypothetical protein